MNEPLAPRSRISPGCKRLSIDFPAALFEQIEEQASQPPAIPVGEWIRRVVAHYAKYPMPTLKQRKKLRMRLDGGTKGKRKRAAS